MKKLVSLFAVLFVLLSSVGSSAYAATIYLTPKYEEIAKSFVLKVNAVKAKYPNDGDYYNFLVALENQLVAYRTKNYSKVSARNLATRLIDDVGAIRATYEDDGMDLALDGLISGTTGTNAGPSSSSAVTPPPASSSSTPTPPPASGISPPANNNTYVPPTPTTSTQTSGAATKWNLVSSGNGVCTTVGGGAYGNGLLATSKCTIGTTVATRTNCTAGDIQSKAPYSYSNYVCVADTTPVVTTPVVTTPVVTTPVVQTPVAAPSVVVPTERFPGVDGVLGTSDDCDAIKVDGITWASCDLGGGRQYQWGRNTWFAPGVAAGASNSYNLGYATYSGTGDGFRYSFVNIDNNDNLSAALNSKKIFVITGGDAAQYGGGGGYRKIQDCGGIQQYVNEGGTFARNPYYDECLTINPPGTSGILKKYKTYLSENPQEGWYGSKIQAACPAGWNLPSANDVRKLQEGVVRKERSDTYDTKKPFSTAVVNAGIFPSTYSYEYNFMTDSNQDPLALMKIRCVKN